MLTPALFRRFRARLLSSDEPAAELDSILVELGRAYRSARSRRACLLELAAAIERHARCLAPLDPGPADELRRLCARLRCSTLPAHLPRF